MTIRRTFRTLLLVATLAALGCVSPVTSTAPDLSTALRTATDAKAPSFLKQPLPIYLVYFTVWEAKGALQRVPDVYGLDRQHTAATTNSQ
jgi:murein L,D-transpeptidase YcbB/YkuD